MTMTCNTMHDQPWGPKARRDLRWKETEIRYPPYWGVNAFYISKL
jgi:hypothetical protein